MSTPKEFFLPGDVELSVDRNSFAHPVQLVMRVGLSTTTPRMATAAVWLGISRPSR